MRFSSLLVFFTVLFISSAAAQTLEEKIGQMVMVGVPANQMAHDTLREDITERNLGGVILFAYNISSPSQVRNLNQELQDSSDTPLFIAVDQEGGLVARLDEHNGYKETYSAETLGENFDSEDSTREQARMMARWLNKAGFNVNLAPVVDVNVNRSSPAIGLLDRSFSSDEEEVYQHASWFIDEFHKKDIVTSTKHFPGHGSARSDSHFGFTDITNTWKQRELVPYKKLIADGYKDMVMTGHLFFKDWDDEDPVSLSHTAVTEKLRDSLGFQGLVITDDLFMGAITDNYGFQESLVKTINAGTDVMLFSTNIREERSLVRKIIKVVKRNVVQGHIEESTIDAAYDRIMRLKEDRIITSSEEPLADAGQPRTLEIGNYPNPFNPITNIEIKVPRRQQLKVKVYNTLGQEIETLANRTFTAGKHHATFNGSGLASGIYFIRVMGEDIMATHRMTLVK